MLQHCRYCDNRHGDLFLCKPAKAVLDALIERGMNMNMPTIEFPDVVPQDGADFVLMSQLVVEAALAPAAGVNWPAIVITGQDYAGQPLPRWLLPGDVKSLRDASRLMQKMTEMAIRKARG
jgi:hypothetical protein